MHPRKLSTDLRLHHSKWLRRRRGILGLSFIAAGCMQLISLYQMGLIRHLPEPPLRRLDADKVDASDEAYGRLSTPDAILGLGSYATTAALAAMGGKDRVERQPWVPVAMGAKVLVDAVQAGKLSRNQWVRHRAFCFWCLVAAGATFAAVPLAIPESLAGLNRLYRGHRR